MFNRARLDVAVFALIFYSILFGPSAARAVVDDLPPATTAITIHQFSGADGASPNGALLRSPGGELYGVTFSGGAGGGGVLFRIDPDGSETVMHSFGALKGDGLNPCGVLARDRNGDIFGTTVGGGAYGLGTVYRVSSSAEYSVLHSFGASRDGAMPYGGLTLGHDGRLYGTTFSGGANSAGTIFVCDQRGLEIILHPFSALDSSGDSTDGAFSYAAVTEGPDHALYGTAAFGGANGRGTLFKITASRKYFVLHAFAAKSSHLVDGANPYAGLILAGDGRFYGTTYSGGAGNYGTIFRIDSHGSFTTLHSFASVDRSGKNGDGANPSAGLTLGRYGRLLGVAGFGGANGSGTLFTMTRNGNFETIYDFPAMSPNSSAVGAARPYGAVAQQANGSLYAAGYYGGAASDGAIVCIDPPNKPNVRLVNQRDIPADDGANITITGFGFTPGAVAKWNDRYLPTRLVSPTEIVATIPASVSPAKGSLVVYNSIAVGSDAAVVNADVHVYDAGVQLISSPFDYSGSSLGDVFREPVAGIAEWLPQTHRYASTPSPPADTLHQGDAYWVRFTSPTGLAAVGVDTALGQPTFSRPLGIGWNMIGDPFRTTVPISSLSVIDAEGRAHTWTDAITRKLIGPALYSYDSQTGSYIRHADGSIEPYIGYWIKARAQVSLRFPRQ